MRQLITLIVLLNVAGAAPTRAFEAPIDTLLGALDGTTADRVDLDAWIEPAQDGHVVRVTVAPRGAMKLVADPGIQVMPDAPSGVRFTAELPAERVGRIEDYWPQAQTLSLPFSGGLPGDVIGLRIDYAYCVVEFQCFFGAGVLRVSVPG